MSTSTAGRDLAALTEAAWQRQDRRLRLMIPALYLGPLVGVLATLAIFEPDAELSPRLVLLLLCYLAIGPLLGVALVTVARRRGAAWVQPSPFSALDRGSRRQLLRAMRRGEPIRPEDHEIAAELAERIRGARWTPFLCSAPLLLQVVNLGHDGVFGLLALVAVVAGVGFAGWSFYVHQRIGSRTDL